MHYFIAGIMIGALVPSWLCIQLAIYHHIEITRIEAMLARRLAGSDALAQGTVLLAQLLELHEKLVELGFESGDVAIHLAKFL